MVPPGRGAAAVQQVTVVLTSGWLLAVAGVENQNLLAL